MPADELLPTAQAARAVGVAKRTLQQWVTDGLLTPTVRTARGGHARWSVDDLRRQLEALQARRDGF